MSFPKILTFCRWCSTNEGCALGATAGLPSSADAESTAGQASSGTHKSIRHYFRELLWTLSRELARQKTTDNRDRAEPDQTNYDNPCDCIEDRSVGVLSHNSGVVYEPKH